MQRRNALAMQTMLSKFARKLEQEAEFCASGGSVCPRVGEKTLDNSLNSSSGASFALVKILGRSQTASLVSHPKIFTNTKSPPQFAELNKETSASPCFASEAKQSILELFLNTDSANLAKFAESATFYTFNLTQKVA
ncbi:hypothetical protein [Helicobacter sp. 23-1045]